MATLLLGAIRGSWSLIGLWTRKTIRDPIRQEFRLKLAEVRASPGN
jgi:hypothetical protein